METLLAQLGNRQDPQTGAVSMPIYHSTTFSHPETGHSTGFDYTRTANPTRSVLESAIATLEGGVRGFAFASGMAAVTCVLTLFKSGDHLVVSDDLYGGTYRLLEQVLSFTGLSTTYVDMSDLAAVEAAIRPNTQALFIETPTNPTMKITDIAGCVGIANRHHIMTIVDNTFMTPYYQKPIGLGADLVVHSATKFLGGHNDVLAGLVVASDETVAARIGQLQNGIGAVLGPQDCWLLMRGMKTLGLRMERCTENAKVLAKWLQRQSIVTRVFYPTLDNHPGRFVHEKQSTGGGGMVSFELSDARFVKPVLDGIKLITFAESLGGVESLMTYPATQTHADMPKDVREAVGVSDRLLRFSVGIEHIDDLMADLAQAFDHAQGEMAAQ
ncbi:MAG: PLP-dependent transferase [Firmicutes bacterium]|nr:PLP-dependent transferase [Bacillota bacterium]